MSTRSALILGARNLGSAIAAHLVAHGWQVACAARSESSLAQARAAGALARAGVKLLNTSATISAIADKAGITRWVGAALRCPIVVCHHDLRWRPWSRPASAS